MYCAMETPSFSSPRCTAVESNRGGTLDKSAAAAAGVAAPGGVSDSNHLQRSEGSGQSVEAAQSITPM